MAACYLYPPGSQRRRLMSPTGGRRMYNKYDKPFDRRRHLDGGNNSSKRKRGRLADTVPTRNRIKRKGGLVNDVSANKRKLGPGDLDGPEIVELSKRDSGRKLKSCKGKGKGSKGSKGGNGLSAMDYAENELESFIDRLEMIDSSRDDWKDRAAAIIAALPEDV